MQHVFRRLRIQQRIGFILLLSVASMALLIVILLQQERQNMEQQKVAELRNLTLSVASLFDSLNQQVQVGELSLEEAQQRALKRVADLRFGLDDYFWLMDLQGNYLMHPFKASLVGQNAAGTQDIQGTYFLGNESGSDSHQCHS